MKNRGARPGVEPAFEEVMALLSGELEEPRRSEIRSYLHREPEMLRAALDCFDSEGLENASELDLEDLDKAWGRFKTDILPSEAENNPEALKIPDGNVVVPKNLPAMPGLAIIPRAVEKSKARNQSPEFAPSKLFSLRQKRFLRDLIAASLGAAATLFLILGGGDPQRSVVLEEIRPRDGQGTIRSGDENTPVVDLVMGADQLALVLIPPSSLTVEIPRVSNSILESKERVIQQDTLLQQDEGTFVLLVSTKKLSTGLHSVRLTGGAGSRFAAFYEFRIAGRTPSEDSTDAMQPEISAPSP